MRPKTKFAISMIVLAAAMIVITFAIMEIPEPQLPEGNLIRDGNMEEEGTDAWDRGITWDGTDKDKAFKPEDITLEKLPSERGGQCLHVLSPEVPDSRSRFYIRTGQKINVNPEYLAGQTFTLSGWLKITSGEVWIEIYTNNAEYRGFNTFCSRGSDKEPEWQYFSITGTFPETITADVVFSIRGVGFGLENKGFSPSRYRIDFCLADLKLEKKGIHAYLLNQNFEQGYVGFDSYTEGFYNDSTVSYTGNYSFKVDLNKLYSSGYGVYTGYLSWDEYKRYKISGWVYGEPGAEANILWVWGNGVCKYYASEMLCNLYIKTNGQWQYFEEVVSTGPEGNSTKFSSVAVFNINGPVYPVYIDDLKIEILPDKADELNPACGRLQIIPSPPLLPNTQYGRLSGDKELLAFELKQQDLCDVSIIDKNGQLMNFVVQDAINPQLSNGKLLVKKGQGLFLVNISDGTEIFLTDSFVSPVMKNGFATWFDNNTKTIHKHNIADGTDTEISMPVDIQNDPQVKQVVINSTRIAVLNDYKTIYLYEEGNWKKISEIYWDYRISGLVMNEYMIAWKEWVIDNKNGKFKGTGLCVYPFDNDLYKYLFNTERSDNWYRNVFRIALNSLDIRFTQETTLMLYDDRYIIFNAYDIRQNKYYIYLYDLADKKLKIARASRAQADIETQLLDIIINDNNRIYYEENSQIKLFELANTRKEDNVIVELDYGISVKFNKVTKEGLTKVIRQEGKVQGIYSSDGYRYTITTDAWYEGNINIVFPCKESIMSVYQSKAGKWNKLPAQKDIENKTISVITNELGMFILGKINKPPVLNAIGNQTIDEGKLLRFKVTASDPDKDKIILSAKKLPKGASFKNGWFLWKPAYNQAGEYKIIFTASDGTESVSETIDISVKNINRPPVIRKLTNKVVIAGKKLSFKVSVYDPDIDKIILSASNLPKGAIFNANTGTFTWVPKKEQAGSYAITFTVRDTENLSASQKVIITVKSPVNNPPVIKTISPITVNEGNTVTINPQVTDADGDKVTITYSGWMNSAARQTNYTDAGEHIVTVTATDGKSLVSQDVRITVMPSVPPVLSALITFDEKDIYPNGCEAEGRHDKVGTWVPSSFLTQVLDNRLYLGDGAPYYRQAGRADFLLDSAMRIKRIRFEARFPGLPDGYRIRPLNRSEQELVFNLDAKALDDNMNYTILQLLVTSRGTADYGNAEADVNSAFVPKIICPYYQWITFEFNNFDWERNVCDFIISNENIPRRVGFSSSGHSFRDGANGMSFISGLHCAYVDNILIEYETGRVQQ